MRRSPTGRSVIANAAAGAPGPTTTQCRGGPLADDRCYDVIIIGTGAGGTLAHGPRPSRKHAHLLERGDHLPGGRDYWSSTAVFVQGKYLAPEFWYASGGEFSPGPGAFPGPPQLRLTAPDPPATSARPRMPVAARADEAGRTAP
jgi:hypothetical protein